MFDYHDLVDNYIGQGDYVRYFDSVAKVPWLYSASEGVLISYDDTESFQYKIDYLKEHSLGGAMFWELAGDTENNELLDSLYRGIITE